MPQPVRSFPTQSPPDRSGGASFSASRCQRLYAARVRLHVRYLAGAHAEGLPLAAPARRTAIMVRRRLDDTRMYNSSMTTGIRAGGDPVQCAVAHSSWLARRGVSGFVFMATSSWSRGSILDARRPSWPVPTKL